MQAMTRLMAILISIFVLTVPAEAQRPRPLGWAMDAMRRAFTLQFDEEKDRHVRRVWLINPQHT